MPLRSNTRFDDYQILNRIDAGGVGEGWRARDLRLKRDVTLRLLPRSFSFNPSRIGHFKHEAEAAAALNHPNIQSFLKVGEWEGAPYVVTEFLQGETLRERLNKERLDAPKAVEIATQLARALAAAHQHCIIHRALTPENVFLLQEGDVKILDFGVAKLTRPVPIYTDANAPDGHMVPGVNLDTMGYLSPEQLRGEQADSRSDIFAFGAIFYELLTGKRAFTGENVAQIRKALLETQPGRVPVSQLAISPHILTVLEDCLNKTREDRVISASEVVVALEASKQAAPPKPAAPPKAPTEVTRIRRPLPVWWLAAGAAVVLMLVLIPIFIVRGQSDPGLAGEGVPLTHDGNEKVASAVVSDGANIYFNETKAGKTLLARINSMGGTSEEFSTSARMPLLAGISPDRTSLLVLSNADWYPPLYEVSVDGGDAQKLSGASGQDAAFAPDGHIVFARGKTLYVAERDGSNARVICVFPHFVYNPAVSPDGRRIRVTVSRDFNTRTIWEVGFDGSSPHPLINTWAGTVDSCCGHWTQDGKYFVFQSRQEGRTDIWALSEEKQWLRQSGTALRLTDGPLSYQLPYPSPDGEHIYAIGVRERGELVRYDRAGKTFVPFLSGMSATDITASSDGRWVTYLSYPEQAIWRRKSDGSDALQLTHANIPAISPRLSPDGTKVVFGSVDADGVDALFVMPAAGGPPRKIARNARMANWSPDSGSVVVFVSEAPGSGTGFFGLRTINLESGKVQSITDSAAVFEAHWISENTLLAPKMNSGAQGLASFDLRTQKWSYFSTGAYPHLVLSADGKYLYYTAGKDDATILRMRLSDQRTEVMANLKDFRPLANEAAGYLMGVAPDGSVVLTRDLGSQEIYSLPVRWP
jgi:eukaryotic-like serine/threonine-protein kinase